MSSDNTDVHLYIIKLFVTGDGIQVADFEKQVRGLLDNEISGEYALDVIDVLQSPAQADEDDILATPTMLVKTTSYERRVIGRLSDHVEVVKALGLT